MTPQQIAERMTGRIETGPGGIGTAFLPSPMVQNHAAFLAWLPDGRLACAWFGGSLEGKSDISSHIATLAPGAAGWSAASRVSDDPARSEQNPVLFVEPDTGRLRLFHTAQVAGNQDTSLVRSRLLDAGVEPVGSGLPEALPLPAGTFVRAPVVVREDGAWLLPLFLCHQRPGERWTGAHDTAAVAITGDRGASWRVVDVPGSLGCVHMSIVALEQGRMVAFYRRRQADFVWRAESADGGESWQVTGATDVPNNNSSIGVIRLRDGRIAMICNPVNATMFADRRASLYDELEEGDDRPDASTAGGIQPIWGVPRAPMAIAVSSDEGHSFPLIRVIEEGPGTCTSNNSEDGRNRELSYPVLIEAADGTIHCAYTAHRRAIKHVRLPPGWLDA
ncbi:sialidase family protein [Frigidibacter sp. MR17.24]|uniref:sialidase family protein n=1 Tax=Frigidibacter sp. MR17.24 TaxID=3127345 RepID=UPI003012A7E3